MYQPFLRRRFHTHSPSPFRCLFPVHSLKSGSHWASDAYVEVADQKRAVELSKRLEEEASFFRDVLAYLTALPSSTQPPKPGEATENRLPPALLQRLSVTLQSRKNRYSAQQVSLWDDMFGGETRKRIQSIHRKLVRSAVVAEVFDPNEQLQSAK